MPEQLTAAEYRALHVPKSPQPAPARRTKGLNPPTATTRPPKAPQSEANEPGPAPRYIRSHGASGQPALRVYGLSESQEAALLEFLTTTLGAVGAG